MRGICRDGGIDVTGKQIKAENDEFKTCLEQLYSGADKLKAYKAKHYTPDVGMEFTTFEEFFLEREKLLVNALRVALMQKR